MFREESVEYQDLVSRIDDLSALEQLSLVVHPPSAQERLFVMMICSYADESEDKRVHSVCILMGRLRDMVELGRRWRIALKEHHLGEFHASHMENRLKPYENLERGHRDFLQRKFIGLITGLDIWGYTSFVELKALAGNKDALLKHMSDTNPYLFTFRMAIEVVAQEIDGYRVKNEPIAFVFDQQKQHEGRAKTMYDHLSQSKWPLAYRLGSLTFASRFEYVELQAADTWAYESRKDVTDTFFAKHEERWQMGLFKTAGRFNIRGYTENELPKLIARLDRGSDPRPLA